RRVEDDSIVKAAQRVIEKQIDSFVKHKSCLNHIMVKLEELKAKRGTLVARARSVEAQGKVQDAMRSIDIMDPTSELSRFEERIRKEEALVQGRAEAAATSLEDAFDELEDDSDSAEIEARLAALRQQAQQG